MARAEAILTAIVRSTLGLFTGAVTWLGTLRGPDADAIVHVSLTAATASSAGSGSVPQQSIVALSGSCGGTTACSLAFVAATDRLPSPPPPGAGGGRGQSSGTSTTTTTSSDGGGFSGGGAGSWSIVPASTAFLASASLSLGLADAPTAAAGVTWSSSLLGSGCRQFTAAAAAAHVDKGGGAVSIALVGRAKACGRVPQSSTTIAGAQLGLSASAADASASAVFVSSLGGSSHDLKWVRAVEAPVSLGAAAAGGIIPTGTAVSAADGSVFITGLFSGPVPASYLLRGDRHSCSRAPPPPRAWRRGAARSAGTACGGDSSAAVVGRWRVSAVACTGGRGRIGRKHDQSSATSSTPAAVSRLCGRAVQ